ncbi:MAG: DEAD/DEAH box helicase [Chloroflexi bacterium]|nr:DEAD/DEAH box helicase [Chloroflexota bacterium]
MLRDPLLDSVVVRADRDSARPHDAGALIEHLRQTLVERVEDPCEILVHDRAAPAKPATSGILRPRLPAPLAAALVRSGIRQLYAHQIASVELLRDGHHAVLSSPTASGKSLAFALPTLERLLADPRRRALYLYPTKALIADQLRGLQGLLAQLPVEYACRVAVLTGDTPREEREDLIALPPAILLANPDILHHSLLPNHRRWRPFLAGLDVVVLDELHTYRGVFGAHVALLIRRLRRLLAVYGAAPAFIAASATIGNAQELAEAVVGLPFVPVVGDAAGAGPRRLVLWRPPLRGDATANEHESVLGEAASVFAEALRAGHSGILFGRARQSVERMLLDVRRLVGPALAPRVSAYKSGYRPEERARIERDLRSGRLRGVVSTNALELGIDIGALDVAVLAGYPGSMMSFWQQAGRVGRRGEHEALVVLVAGDDALDQFYVSHPDAFFGRAMEHAVVDPSNAAIQLGHLLCAAHERPLEEAELSSLFPPNARSLLERLASVGEVSAGPPWTARGRSPYSDVSLRGTSRAPFTLQSGGRAIGTIEPPYLQRECYPGALYLHNGQAYRATAIDEAARVVRLESSPRAGRTSPLLDVAVEPPDQPAATRKLRLGETDWPVGLGPLVVRETVVGYREQRRGENLTHALETPLSLRLDTVGLWLDVPSALEPDQPALHAFEHALINALPLEVLCDRRDVGSSNAGARVYIYDLAQSGTGLAEKAYQLLEAVLGRAASLLRDCPCTEGCPNCVHLAGCPSANSQLDKLGGRALLEGRAVPTSRAVRALLDDQPAAPRRPPADRRRVLREIAEADLRERFADPVGSSSSWLEVNGLADLAGVGLVVVWDLGARSADVQPLAGGMRRRVSVKRLRPPRAS